MTQQIQSIKSAELKSFLADNPFYFLRLLSPEGDVIIPFNGKRGDLAKWTEQANKVLKSAMYPDGVYVVEYRDHQKAKSKIFYVLKGNVSAPSNLEEPIRLPAKREEATMSAAAILEMKVENERLKMEVEQLKNQIEDLQLEEDELSEDDNDGLLGKLIEHGIPVINDMLSAYKERTNAIKSVPVENSTLAGRAVVNKNRISIDAINKLASELKKGLLSNADDCTEDERNVLQLIQFGTPITLQEFVMANMEANKEATDNFVYLVLQLRPDANQIFTTQKTA